MARSDYENRTLEWPERVMKSDPTEGSRINKTQIRGVCPRSMNGYKSGLLRIRSVTHSAHYLGDEFSAKFTRTAQ